MLIFYWNEEIIIINTFYAYLIKLVSLSVDWSNNVNAVKYILSWQMRVIIVPLAVIRCTFSLNKIIKLKEKYF